MPARTVSVNLLFFIAAIRTCQTRFLRDPDRDLVCAGRPQDKAPESAERVFVLELSPRLHNAILDAMGFAAGVHADEHKVALALSLINAADTLCPKGRITRNRSSAAIVLGLSLDD